MAYDDLIAQQIDTWKKWVAEAGGVYEGVQQTFSVYNPASDWRPQLCFHNGPKKNALLMIPVDDVTPERIAEMLGKKLPLRQKLDLDVLRVKLDNLMERTKDVSHELQRLIQTIDEELYDSNERKD
jgi:hypothetical protein